MALLASATTPCPASHGTLRPSMPGNPVSPFGAVLGVHPRVALPGLPQERRMRGMLGEAGLELGWPQPNQFCRGPSEGGEGGCASSSSFQGRGRWGWVGFVSAAALPPPEPPGDTSTPSPAQEQSHSHGLSLVPRGRHLQPGFTPRDPNGEVGQGLIFHGESRGHLASCSFPFGQVVMRPARQSGLGRKAILSPRVLQELCKEAAPRHR